jgi:hypothetical protein
VLMGSAPPDHALPPCTGREIARFESAQPQLLGELGVKDEPSPSLPAATGHPQGEKAPRTRCQAG